MRSIVVKQLPIEFGLELKNPMSIHFDNQSAIYIAKNPVFHDLPTAR